MKLIGLYGGMGAGKSTAASYLQDMHSYKVTSFAAPLKKAAEILFDLEPIAFLEEGKKQIDPYWGITRRHMLQVLGTECMRQNFGADFWTRRAERTLNSFGNCVVFDDVRFPEESNWIHSKGGIVIRIIRDTGIVSTHASETSQPSYDASITNQGSLNDLFMNLTETLKIHGK